MSLGLFIGIHCADGSIPKYSGRNQYRWEFGDQNKEAARFVVNLVKKVFGVDAKIQQRGNQYVVFVKSKNFWTHLTQELKLPVGKKSRTISLPKILPQSEHKNFVNGVIGSDGFVFKDYNRDGSLIPRIRLSIVSKDLRDDVSRILSDNEIHHTIGEFTNKTNPPRTNKIYVTKFYRLDINGHSAVKYFKEFGIWHPVQRKKFLTFYKSFRQGSVSR